jgi:hypothetical protein
LRPTSPSRIHALAATLLVGLVQIPAAVFAGTEAPSGTRRVAVSGTGIDFLKDAIVHSKEATATGWLARSTEDVELDGDLHGRVLYHVTTRVDTSKGTLTNTGDQVFSGTVAGSKPVMIHDSKFRFEVNLNTGAESGSVFLIDHIAGPRVRCELNVTGTGKTAEGNPTFRYAGTCEFT